MLSQSSWACMSRFLVGEELGVYPWCLCRTPACRLLSHSCMLWKYIPFASLCASDGLDPLAAYLHWHKKTSARMCPLHINGCKCFAGAAREMSSLGHVWQHRHPCSRSEYAWSVPSCAGRHTVGPLLLRCIREIIQHSCVWMWSKKTGDGGKCLAHNLCLHLCRAFDKRRSWRDEHWDYAQYVVQSVFGRLLKICTTARWHHFRGHGRLACLWG